MVGGKPFLGPKGERGGEGWKAGACHRKAEMQVRASAAPVQVAGLRLLPKLAREGSAQPRLSQGFSGQQSRPSLACLGESQITPEPRTQAEASGQQPHTKHLA